MAERLDTIAFRLGQEDFPGYDPELVVVVEVNGSDLREVLPRVDDGEAFVPAAHAGSLDYWLGRPPPLLGHEGRTAVLVCGCMDFRCGGIAARISVSEDRITWSEISHPYAAPLPVGPFRFDRFAYENAVRSLQSGIQSD